MVMELTDILEIQEVLKDCHDSKSGGHLGMTGTIDKIQKNYSWPSMIKDIKDYVETCDVCQRCKHSRVVKIPMKVTSVAKEVFFRVMIDLVGPFTETIKGSKYVLSIMCDLSKYVVLVPLKDATAESVAIGLSERLFCIFGVPVEILSDRAQNFLGKVMQSLCKLFKIKKVNTTSFRPQSNPIEAYHFVLNSYLRCLTETSKTEWDEILPYAAFSYNTKTHSSTNYTPFEVVFGRQANLPLSIHRKPDPVYNYDDVVMDIRQKNQLTWSIARENSKKK
jgi:hypothetical protein